MNELELQCALLTLDPTQQTAVLTLEIDRAADDITIEVTYSGKGTLSVSEIGIHETSNYYKRTIVYALFLCAFLVLAYVFYYSSAEKRKIIFSLGAIFAASCYPLMTDYMIVGHDLPFHLLRIEGIYQGLLQGDFPVKVHPVWANGYGYAVGIFYGDAFLYLPAFLRIMGFSIQSAYKYFAAFMNLGTVLISYFCFKKIFKSTKTGLAGCLIYTFSVYRLADMYTRAAVGEYTAMMILPVVFYGFYKIFTETDLKKHWFKYASIVAIGLTGILQSHVLSCEMLAVFILLACLILIKKVVKPFTFLSLASGAVLTLLMNLGFLVPFLDYYDSIHISSEEWGTYSIQNKGMFPVQLLGLMQRTTGGSWAAISGVNNEVAYPLGLVITLCVGLFLYLVLCCNEDKNNPLRKPAILCCVLGGLALFMSSCFFPWDALAATGTLMNKLIINLQFPWRFLSIATILLTVPACYALANIGKYISSRTSSAIMAVLATTLIVSTGWYYYDFVYTMEPYRVYETYELNSMNMYSYEYLPANTNPDEIKRGKIICSDGTSYSQYYKEGTNITCIATANSTGGTIDFPLNYYHDYVCRDLNTGEELTVEAGYNNMVRVNLPSNYNGQFRISFKEPIHWRASEIVSLITLLAVAIAFSYPYLSTKLKRTKKA